MVIDPNQQFLILEVCSAICFSYSIWQPKIRSAPVSLQFPQFQSPGSIFSVSLPTLYENIPFLSQLYFYHLQGVAIFQPKAMTVPTCILWLLCPAVQQQCFRPQSRIVHSDFHTRSEKEVSPGLSLHLGLSWFVPQSPTLPQWPVSLCALESPLTYCLWKLLHLRFLFPSTLFLQASFSCPFRSLF